ncbi:MAG: SDR family NAD(P)-dependent oxidoreductase, partial [Firmicutes bacterium]|nr:SDR family NAD(P)-dependent oxidoreductase [Bacillota bacterium]
MQDVDLRGKVALVTGSSRGIGRAMALGLAHFGADIVVVSRNYEEFEKTAEEIRLMGIKALSLKCDVTKKSEVGE